MRLLIDAGNSRLKWAVAGPRGWDAQGDLGYAELGLLADVLPSVDRCFIASVTGDRHERALRELLGKGQIRAEWLAAERRFDDLANGYDDPAQLGVDRWMAVIAAHARKRGPLLVVSVGTAMTVDAVSTDGTFLGGLIVLRDAIAQGTARVAAGNGCWQPFPSNSADAVQSGIIAALAGAVLVQHRQLAASAEDVCCFLTGGGAAMLQPHLPVALEWVPNLVLEGIDRVAQERRPA